MEEFAKSANISIDNTDTAAIEIKRGRGRPRKYPLSSTSRITNSSGKMDKITPTPDKSVIKSLLTCHEIMPPYDEDGSEINLPTLQEIPKNKKSKKVQKLSSPRRSSRCPKKKAAPIIQATMAVERDAQPFQKSCWVCGEDFYKKSGYSKHLKMHKTNTTQAAKTSSKPSTPAAEAAAATIDQDDKFGDDDQNKKSLFWHKTWFSPVVTSGANTMLTQIISLQKPLTSAAASATMEDGSMDTLKNEGQYQDEEKLVNPCFPVEIERPIIPFTSKRPSLTSLTMKDPILCGECGMTFTRRAHLNRHMLLHRGIKPFACDICKIRFTRKDHMIAHKLKHEIENIKLPCAQCGRGFSTWMLLKDHIKNVHSSTTFRPPIPVAPEPNDHSNPNNACNICGRKFLYRRYLEAHEKRFHLNKEANVNPQLTMLQNGSIDQDCDQDSDQDTHDDDDTHSMDENILKVSNENDEQEQDETIQSEPTNSPSTITNNEQEMDGVDSYSIHTQDNFQRQQNVEYNLFPKRKSLLSQNRILKLAEEEMSNSGRSHNSSSAAMRVGIDKDDLDDLLDYDYKAMKNPSIRSGDMNDSEGDEEEDDGQIEEQQAFECADCGEIFTERAELRTHYYLIHKKRYICGFCGLELSSKRALLRHHLVHTGIKEFACELCDRRYSRKDILQTHLQAHEKSWARLNMPKPFVCKICTQAYTLKSNLQRHIKMCHDKIVVADRAKILNQIKQKYKNGIPSSDLNEVQIQDQQQIKYRIRGPRGQVKSVDTRPFSCKICPQRFTHRSNLSRHMRHIHNIIRPAKRLPVHPAS